MRKYFDFMDINLVDEYENKVNGIINEEIEKLKKLAKISNNDLFAVCNNTLTKCLNKFGPFGISMYEEFQYVLQDKIKTSVKNKGASKIDEFINRFNLIQNESNPKINPIYLKTIQNAKYDDISLLKDTFKVNALKVEATADSVGKKIETYKMLKDINGSMSFFEALWYIVSLKWIWGTDTFKKEAKDNIVEKAIEGGFKQEEIEESFKDESKVKITEVYKNIDDDLDIELDNSIDDIKENIEVDIENKKEVEVDYNKLNKDEIDELLNDDINFRLDEANNEDRQAAMNLVNKLFDYKKYNGPFLEEVVNEFEEFGLDKDYTKRCINIEGFTKEEFVDAILYHTGKAGDNCNSDLDLLLRYKKDPRTKELILLKNMFIENLANNISSFNENTYDTSLFGEDNIREIPIEIINALKVLNFKVEIAEKLVMFGNKTDIINIINMTIDGTEDKKENEMYVKLLNLKGNPNISTLTNDQLDVVNYLAKNIEKYSTILQGKDFATKNEVLDDIATKIEQGLRLMGNLDVDFRDVDLNAEQAKMMIMEAAKKNKIEVLEIDGNVGEVDPDDFYFDKKIDDKQIQENNIEEEIVK